MRGMKLLCAIGIMLGMAFVIGCCLWLATAKAVLWPLVVSLLAGVFLFYWYGCRTTAH
jgi:hypothetical protein